MASWLENSASTYTPVGASLFVFAQLTSASTCKGVEVFFLGERESQYALPRADRSRIASGGSALAHAWHDLLEPWHSFHAWCHARAAAPAILFLFLTTKQ